MGPLGWTVTGADENSMSVMTNKLLTNCANAGKALFFIPVRTHEHLFREVTEKMVNKPVSLSTQRCVTQIDESVHFCLFTNSIGENIIYQGLDRSWDKTGGTAVI